MRVINSEGKTNSFVKRILTPALPVVLGYIPVGFAYGVLGVNAGIGTFNTILMSIIVFAGSSQLMATGFFAQGLNPFSIIITTFIVNLRHMLMSASLSTHMKAWKKSEVAGFCYELTDETFAVHSLRFNGGDTAALPAMSINLICQLSWVVGTILGALAGTLISDVRPFALDYALPAMFIALLILQVHNRNHITVAIVGSVISIILWKSGITQWNVILATVIGATLGAILETSKKKVVIESAMEVEHE